VQPASAVSEDEESKKRRKVLQEALEMDKDADSDEDDAGGDDTNGLNGKNAKCAMDRVVHFCVGVDTHK
jgi:protein CWC15